MPIWEYVKQKLIDRSERPRGVLPSLPHRTLTLAANLLVTVTRLREARRLAERERDESLADMRCRKEIAERVGRLRVDTQRQWGKMSVHQMVCNLADSFRGVMGEERGR